MRRILALLGLGALSSTVNVLPPLVFGSVVDAVVAHLNGTHGGGLSMWQWIGVFALLTVAGDFLRIYYGYSVTDYSNRLVVDLRERLAFLLLSGSRTPPSMQKETSRSQLSYLINADCGQVPSLYAVPMTTVLSDVFDSLLILVIVTVLSWKLGLILAVPIVPVFLIARWAGRKQNKIAADTRSAETQFSDHADHISTSYTTIAVFGGQRLEQSTSRTLLGSIWALNKRANNNLATMMASVSALRLAASVLAVGYAVKLASDGEIAVGTIATVMLYLARFYSPAINLSKSYQAVQRAVISVDRIGRVLLMAGAESDSAATHNADSASGTALEHSHPAPAQVHLAARGVGIRLAENEADADGDGGDSRVVDIPDFEIVNHGLVLVVGPSGAGKSSLVKALLGVDPPPALGSFVLNGEPLREHPRAQRYAMFSYAGQDDSLVRGTVLECASYPDTSSASARTRALAALERVNIASLAGREIADTRYALSGGEARRVVLARALARQAPVLIADEVTSALDERTRGHVEQILIAESRQRAVIAVAHSPSQTLQDAATTIVSLFP